MGFEWIGAAAQAAAKVLSAGGDQYSSSKAYRRSVNTAKHAHQWEVQDLKAAGLNPILSAGGSGASAQSFQAAPMDLDISEGLSRGAQVEQAKANARLADAEIGKVKSETAKNVASAAREVAEIDHIREDIKNLIQDRDFKTTAAWKNVGESLEILPRILSLGSTRQMQLAQAGMFGELAGKARLEGLISGQELKAILSDPQAYKEKLFQLYAPMRTVDYYGRGAVRGIENRRNQRKSSIRNNKGHPSSGGKVRGW